MSRPCKVDGCPHYARVYGHCPAHHSRLLRHEDVMADVPLGELPKRIGVSPEPVMDILFSDTAKRLAERFGVTPRTVSRWRAGARIELGNADLIAAATGNHLSTLWPDA